MFEIYIYINTNYSVASMMEGSAKLSNNNIVVTNDKGVMADKDGDYCEDLDENGDGFEKLVDSSWKCKKQFKEEDYSSLSSDHHHHRRSLLRSSENNYYSTPDNCSITKKSAAGGTVTRRTRPARASKKVVSAAAGGSNPYEFYYYSGFGPLWGKKRRDRGGEDCGRSSENTMGIRSNATTPSPSPSDELDYVDDDDDEEEEVDGDCDGGKKRMRKPVKARSLKSLM